MGLPFTFIRLSECNLRCSYCDTKYAYHQGNAMAIHDVLDSVRKFPHKRTLITGGEPLLQVIVYDLMKSLLKEKYTVLLETNGSLPVDSVPEQVIKIMDIKTPSSGESHKMLMDNINCLTSQDQVKFVISDDSDFLWAKQIVLKHNLEQKCQLLFSPRFGTLQFSQLASWILESSLDVRLQLQLHKIIWKPQTRGV